MSSRPMNADSEKMNLLPNKLEDGTLQQGNIKITLSIVDWLSVRSVSFSFFALINVIILRGT
jgi:hypothetical protein